MLRDDLRQHGGNRRLSIRVTDERDGGRVDEYDCPRGANKWGEAFSLTDGISEEETFAAATEKDWEACQNGLAADFLMGIRRSALCRARETVPPPRVRTGIMSFPAAIRCA